MADGCIINYVFAPDGTGSWSDFCTNGLLTHLGFDWFTQDGQLIIRYNTINLTLVYQYRINDGVLELWDEQDEHSLKIWEPQPLPANSPFIGTWFTNIDADLNLGYGVHNYNVYFTFNADGTGAESTYWSEGEWWYLYNDFTWRTEDGVMTVVMDNVILRWFYTISGDTLILHRLGNSMEFERV